MKKLILHIPHSSTNIPLLEGYVANSNQIQNEIVKLTDWYTDELFFSETDATIVAPFSRIFCDVERFENDEDEIMSKVGMGAVYERFDNGDLLRNVTSELRTKIIKDFYWKHHNTFSDRVKEELNQSNRCLIIDCHSYPSTPIIRDLDQTAVRPDFNIGIDSYHTPKNLIAASVDFFENKGYSLGVDWPYKGTIVPMDYYKKNKSVCSIMLEVNRKLYLNEPTNEKSNQFEETKRVVQSFLEMIKKEA
jgi:N-formylglutamate amidohydrolase